MTIIKLLMISSVMVTFGQTQYQTSPTTQQLDQTTSTDFRRWQPMNEGQRDHWYKQNNLVKLSKDEVAAVKNMIHSSKCDWETIPQSIQIAELTNAEVDQTEVNKPWIFRVPPPKDCRSTKNLFQCDGKVKCQAAALTFYVGATCFMKETKDCSNAQACAEQSDFALRGQSEQYVGSQTYQSLFYWGYEDGK